MNSRHRDAYLFRTGPLQTLSRRSGACVGRRGISIRRGEYAAIMGPSGSGKSTLLNILGALDKPTSGEVFFDGQPLSRMRNLDRLRVEKFGFVFQSFHLLPILTAVENVQVPMFEGTLGAAARVRKAKELLALVGMEHRSTTCPRNCRWASGSEWPSPARWPTIPSRCWPTSPRAIWIRCRRRAFSSSSGR